MKKLFPDFYFSEKNTLIINLFLFILLFGCSKTNLDIKRNSFENISKQELSSWISNYPKNNAQRNKTKIRPNNKNLL